MAFYREQISLDRYERLKVLKAKELRKTVYEEVSIEIKLGCGWDGCCLLKDFDGYYIIHYLGKEYKY